MKFWFTKTSSNKSDTEEFDIIDQLVDKDGGEGGEGGESGESKESGEGGETANNFYGFHPRINTYTNYLHTLMKDSFPEYKNKYGSFYQQWKMNTIDLANVTKNEAVEVFNGLKQQNIKELLQTRPKIHCGHYNDTGL